MSDLALLPRLERWKELGLGSDFEPKALLNQDSLLDLIELGYYLGRHGEYDNLLKTKRRIALADHLDAFLKSKQ